MYEWSKKGIETYFDGKKFFNRDGHFPHTFKAVFRWFLNRRKEAVRWPKWVSSAYGPTPPSHILGPKVRITFINHSTFLIQTQGLNFLTDPVWSHRIGPLGKFGLKRVRNPGLALHQVPKIDAILISHNHYDHLDLPTLKYFYKRDHPKIFCGLGVNTHFKYPSLPMAWGDKHDLSEKVSIIFVPAQHFSGRGLFDHGKTLWGGFVLKTPSHKIYFAGDTGYGPHFKEIYKEMGPMNVALLPIGSYKPHWFMAHVHTAPEEAVKAHLDLHAQVSLGMHFHTFRLSDEAYDEPLKDLKNALKHHEIRSSKFKVLKFGESWKSSRNMA